MIHFKKSYSYLEKDSTDNETGNFNSKKKKKTCFVIQNLISYSRDRLSLRNTVLAWHWIYLTLFEESIKEFYKQLLVC